MRNFDSSRISVYMSFVRERLVLVLPLLRYAYQIGRLRVYVDPHICPAQMVIEKQLTNTTNPCSNCLGLCFETINNSNYCGGKGCFCESDCSYGSCSITTTDTVYGCPSGMTRRGSSPDHVCCPSASTKQLEENLTARPMAEAQATV